MASYNIGSSNIYDTKKKKDHVWSFMAPSDSMKDPLLL